MKKKAEVYRDLRDSGMTFQEIASLFGVSKQAVEQTLNPNRHGISVGTKFLGLKNWMESNNVKFSELSKMTGIKAIHLRRCLLRCEVETRKSDIDAIIKVTGMTYEELFCEDSGGDSSD